MEKKIIGYRCFDNDNNKSSNQFTIGKIYQLINYKSLNDPFAFIDNNGDRNGWYYNNHKHFKPVYEDEEPNLTQYLTYNLGIDFNKLKECKSNLIKLLAENHDLENHYILELIDSIQDYAVDNHNISRSEVFDVNEEFGI